jgi:hypothetical protein
VVKNPSSFNTLRSALDLGCANRLDGKDMIVAMTMTNAEFELIARLLKSKEPVTSGARLVILRNVPNAEAARAVGATPQSVHRSVKRVLEVHDEIAKTFSKSLSSSCSR